MGTPWHNRWGVTFYMQVSGHGFLFLILNIYIKVVSSQNKI